MFRIETRGPKGDNLLTSIGNGWHANCLFRGMIAAGIQTGAELDGTSGFTGIESTAASGQTDEMRPGEGSMRASGDLDAADSGSKWTSFLELFGLPSQAGFEKGGQPVSAMHSGAALGDAQRKGPKETAQGEPAGNRPHAAGRTSTQQAGKPARTTRVSSDLQKTNEDAGRSLAETPAPGTCFAAAMQTPMNTPSFLDTSLHGSRSILSHGWTTSAPAVIASQPGVGPARDGSLEDASQTLRAEAEPGKRRGQVGLASTVASSLGVPGVLEKQERSAPALRVVDGAPTDADEGAQPSPALGFLKETSDARSAIVTVTDAGGSTPAGPQVPQATRGGPSSGFASFDSIHEQPAGVADSSTRLAGEAADLSVRRAVHAGSATTVHASNADPKQNPKAARQITVDDSIRGFKSPSTASNDVNWTIPLRGLDASSVPGTRVEARQTMPHATLEGPRETFAALDAAPAGPLPTWIHAGVHRAEAGYLDPSVGWVGVHAEVVGSGLHAALTPSSTEAERVLGGHLVGLNEYMSEHHGASATVTLTAFESGQGGAAPGSYSESGSGGRETASGAKEDLEMERAAEQAPGTVHPPARASALTNDARYISVFV